MNQHLNGKRMTHFQRIFAAFCVLVADSCIFLFFLIAASKLHPLLIMNTLSEIRKTNRIQRGFLFNGAIATRDAFLASTHPRQKTNFYKQTVRSLHAVNSLLYFGEAFELRFTNLFKRTLIQMALYGHLKCFQPQNSLAKKQTFSNGAIKYKDEKSPETPFFARYLGIAEIKPTK